MFSLSVPLALSRLARCLLFVYRDASVILLLFFGMRSPLVVARSLLIDPLQFCCLLPHSPPLEMRLPPPTPLVLWYAA